MSIPKPIKIKQTDHDGHIREVEVMVSPHKTSSAPFPFLPFGKKHKAWVEAQSKKGAVKERALELVAAAYSWKKKSAIAALPGATPGEIALILKGIDQDHDMDRTRVADRKNRTNEVMLENFNADDDASLERVQSILDAIKYEYNEIIVRERMVFFDITKNSYGTIIRPCIDNLRVCHPSLALEDLSDLEGEDLEFARKLLNMSLIRYESESDKISGRRSYSKSAWEQELDSVRTEILRYSPHMTAPLVEVILNHPDRLEQVLSEIKNRGLPLHQADDLINDIIKSTSVLSEGAL